MPGPIRSCDVRCAMSTMAGPAVQAGNRAGFPSTVKDLRDRKSDMLKARHSAKRNHSGRKAAISHGTRLVPGEEGPPSKPAQGEQARKAPVRAGRLGILPRSSYLPLEA